MNDYIVLNHIEGTPVPDLPREKQEQHLNKVDGFINSMAENGILKDALPFEPKGISIKGIKGDLTECEITTRTHKRAGFYHITAASMEGARELIKTDPRFEDREWNLEIWPILKLTS